MILSDHIKSAAQRLGFDLCGIARCQNLDVNERAYMRWLEAGYDSSLGYMRNHLDKRFDVRQLVEGAKTVVVCAVSYKSEISGGYSESDRCKIASYACNRDYHKTLKKMLLRLLSELQSQYPQLQGRAFVDSAPLLEKQYAVEAGLGWIGRQSLLVTPEFGSYVLLGELVLDMEADAYDAPYEGVGCGECRRCIDACPNRAIGEQRMIDSRRCISRLTIEREATAPEGCGLHGWAFGCEECQNVCPHNHSKPLATHPAIAPTFDPREMTAEDWCTMSEEEFSARFARTPMSRSGLERIIAAIRE